MGIFLCFIIYALPHLPSWALAIAALTRRVSLADLRFRA